MSTARFLICDVFEGLRSLPDDSVDLVLTSPPFFALRSYLSADDPNKAREIGSEPTPAAFIDTLLRVVAECDRVLTPHGSIAIELGDTYAGSGGGGGDYSADGLRAGQAKFDGSGRRVRETRREGYIRDGVLPPPRRDLSQGFPLDKSLCLIPESFRFALAYGTNPHTGQESPAGRWRVRNVVRWWRPNPPVGALGDKFRPATSELVVACRERDRYFDLDAVRTLNNRADETYSSINERRTAGGLDGERDRPNGIVQNPAGAPPLDTWIIPTAPYKGAHYATWPPELCIKPIEAMCPRKVCRVCGEPSRRVVESDRPSGAIYGAPGRSDAGRIGGSRLAKGGAEMQTTYTTVGWTDCGHADWRAGTVLDPFAGSGTTLAVATGHGRDAIGFDLDERNAALALERIGMFLTVETLERVAVVNHTRPCGRPPCPTCGVNRSALPCPTPDREAG